MRAAHRSTGCSQRSALSSSRRARPRTSGLRWQRQASLAIASSTKLAHQLNEFATRLAEDLRNTGGRLEAWLGEQRSRQLVDGSSPRRLPPRPPDQQPRSGAAELDRGTEDHRLREKAAYPRSDLHTPSCCCSSLPRPAERAAADPNLTAPITAAVWTPKRATRPPPTRRPRSQSAGGSHHRQGGE